MIAHESFSELGIMILSLAAIFGVLFFLLKNVIDRLGKSRVYTLAVYLYALSWVLRGFTSDQLPLDQLYISLVVITFCTTFFRLAMNKRFYDLAKLTRSHDYLVLKSYYTQFAIMIIFATFGMLTFRLEADETLLNIAYWSAAALALVYLMYGAQRHSYTRPEMPASAVTDSN
jgi:hypothetical protein